MSNEKSQFDSDDGMTVLHISEVIELPRDEASEMAAQLAKLREENRLLTEASKAKIVAAAARKARAENSLPIVQSYESDLLASIEDIADMMTAAGLIESSADIPNARSMVKLFGLTAQAQMKAVGARGRGDHLYLKPEVIHAITSIVTARTVTR